jgi:hypothetical protein
MSTRRSHHVIAAVAATCCLAGGVAAVVSSGASAQTPQPAKTSEGPVTVVAAEDRGGLATMSSPVIPGVPHVPSNVLLTISPDGRFAYVGPEGSMYNGPADEVAARVDAWWAEQMAAGVSPGQANKLLAKLSR